MIAFIVPSYRIGIILLPILDHVTCANVIHTTKALQLQYRATLYTCVILSIIIKHYNFNVHIMY